MDLTKATSRTKFPKKKVALILAYLGTGYQGMQMYEWPIFYARNPNARTIESVLFKSLVDSELVSDLNSMDQKKVFVGCFSIDRVDEGVSYRQGRSCCHAGGVFKTHSQ